MYDSSERTYEIAKKLNLTIKPSVNKNKKIDVYKNGEFIKSIGAINFKERISPRSCFNIPFLWRAI